MSKYFILKGHDVVPVDSLEQWAKQFELMDKHVAQDMVGDVLISTVFLGINHRFGGGLPPLVFETMIFGGEHDGYQERCSTWDEAEAQHAAALALMKKNIN